MLDLMPFRQWLKLQWLEVTGPYRRLYRRLARAR